MNKILADYDINELLGLLCGQPKYIAKQILSFCARGADIDGMTSLPKKLRDELKLEFFEKPLYKAEIFNSKDGSAKFLFKLNDGNLIESVFLPNNYGNTVCVSSQVGCRMGCAFCASGMDGLARNLSAGEMLSQVALINSHFGGSLKERAVSNIVMMGSGEPLDNYDNTLKFVNLISSPDGLNVSERNISVSTSGLCDGIVKLAESGHNVTLSISLHAPNDDIRKQIMPIAKRYTVKEVVGSAKYYFEKTGRRVIFEYSLIKGVNDSLECAKELSELLKGFPLHVNLINLNPVKDAGLKPSGKDRAGLFLAELEKKNISATFRRSLGSDIEGACGQLKRKYLKEVSHDH